MIAPARVDGARPRPLIRRRCRVGGGREPVVDPLLESGARGLQVPDRAPTSRSGECGVAADDDLRDHQIAGCNGSRSRDRERGSVRGCCIRAAAAAASGDEGDRIDHVGSRQLCIVQAQLECAAAQRPARVGGSDVAPVTVEDRDGQDAQRAVAGKAHGPVVRDAAPGGCSQAASARPSCPDGDRRARTARRG